MDNSEIEFVQKYLKVDDIMLEWGSGGSTFEFSKYVKSYFSVESSKNFYEKIKDTLPLNVNYFLVRPEDESDLSFSDYRNLGSVKKKDLFLNYINFPNTLDQEFYDKVLIDGRARGFCAEAILPYLKEDSIVFIHDFVKRKQYHIVLDWYDEIDRINYTKATIVALKRKFN